MTLDGDVSVGDIVGYISGRTGQMINCKVNDAFGWSPTVAETITWTNCNMGVQMEVDKSVDVFRVVGGTINKFLFQSSSVNLLQITGGATVTYIAGTPKNTIIDGSTVSHLQVGVGYGGVNSVSVHNSAVALLDITGNDFVFATLGYSCASGIIQCAIPVPQNLKMLQWAVPGCWLRFKNSAGRWVGSAKVLDVWRDATTNYVQTSLTGGFPPGAVSLNNHPCPKFNGSNNTGGLTILDHSMPKAQGKPIYSYCFRTYNHTLLPTGMAVADYPAALGKIISITVEVVTVYSGSQGALVFHLSAADNWPINRADGTTSYSMDIRIDAKRLGIRTFTPGSSTGLGGLDAAAFPTGTSTITVDDIMGRNSNSQPNYQVATTGKDVSSEALGPVITVEIICDQGIT
jgi:hypothetical protein